MEISTKRTIDHAELMEAEDLDNKQAIILDIHRASPITVYKNYLYPLSVICTYPEADNWLINHFINIYLMYEPDGYIWYDFLEQQFFLSDILDRKYINIDELRSYPIIELIENTLLERKYVTIYLNENDIKESIHYHKHDVISEFFIYGFDHNNSKFYGFSFNANNVMGLVEYDYDEILQAHTSFLSLLDGGYPQKIWFSWEAFSSIEKKPYSYSLCIDALIEEIEDYNESKEKKEYLRKEIVHERGTKAIYGAATMKAIVDALYLLLEGKCIIDYRFIHLIWEHKKIMLQRMIYISSGLNTCEELINQYEEIVNRAQTCRFLYLKGLCTSQKGGVNIWGCLQDETIIRRIIDILESIIKDEETILRNFIAVIKKESDQRTQE